MLYFEEFYSHLLDYKEQYGDLFVPSKYVVGDYKLGSRVCSLRCHPERLSEDEFKKLNELGFVWRIKSKHSFEEVYGLLEEYKNEYGNCNIGRDYVTPSGVKLGNILYCILEGITIISVEEREKLSELGFVKRK